MERDAAEPRPRELTAAERDQLEMLARQLQILKRRGDRTGADKVLEEMKSVSPDSAYVWEAIGDDLLERGQQRKAKEAYGKAHELDPTNIPLERKFAMLVLATDAYSVSPQSALEASATGKTATVLSFLLPGLGQLATGQALTGGLFLGGYLLGWFMLFLIPNAIPGLLRVLGFAGQRGGEFNILTLVPLLMIVGFYFASLLHASSQAAKFKKVEIPRPIPPVDKEF